MRRLCSCFHVADWCPLSIALRMPQFQRRLASQALSSVKQPLNRGKVVECPEKARQGKTLLLLLVSKWCARIQCCRQGRAFLVQDKTWKSEDKAHGLVWFVVARKWRRSLFWPVMRRLCSCFHVADWCPLSSAVRMPQFQRRPLALPCLATPCPRLSSSLKKKFPAPCICFNYKRLISCITSFKFADFIVVMGIAI